MANVSKLSTSRLAEAFNADQKALAVKSPSRKRALFRLAESLYKKVLTTEPKNLLALRGLATVYLHTLEFSKSITLYRRALSVAPASKKFFYYSSIGNVYRAWASYDTRPDKNYAKSIEYYQKAIRINPNLVLFWSNLSASYAGLKDWDKAIKAINKALVLLKKEKIPHGNLKKMLTLEKSLYAENKKRTPY